MCCGFFSPVWYDSHDERGVGLQGSLTPKAGSSSTSWGRARARMMNSMSCFDELDSPCVSGIATGPPKACGGRDGLGGCVLQSMLQRDFDRFLPDDVLVKLDRASMASSLEARAPLLDHRVVEFARAMAVGDGGSLHLNETKWALRRVLDKYVPRHLWDRPKQGFHAPIEKWLRSGPLRDWMEDLLSTQSLANSGVFDHALIEKRLTSFLNGDDRHFFGLWNILMFQAWHREKKTEFKISV